MYNLKEFTIPILCGVSSFSIWYVTEPLIFKSNMYLQAKNFKKYISSHNNKIAVMGYFISPILGISLGVLYNKLGGPIIPEFYNRINSNKIPKIKKLRREGYSNNT
tara:strand:- start:643 stop:960 length:318 start_codon:yes stop_codon:yes gene_type:complete